MVVCEYEWWVPLNTLWDIPVDLFDLVIAYVIGMNLFLIDKIFHWDPADLQKVDKLMYGVN